MVYEITRADSDGLYQPESRTETETFMNRDDVAHFVVLSQKPSSHDCFALIRNTHYSKESGREELISLRIIDWMDMSWYIISVPKIEKALMVRAATANYLTIISIQALRQSAIDWSDFPLLGENIYVLLHREVLPHALQL